MNLLFLKNLLYKMNNVANRQYHNITNKFFKRNKIIDNKAHSVDLNILNETYKIQVLDLPRTDYHLFCEDTQLFQNESIMENPKKALEFFFSYKLLGINNGDQVLDAAGGDGNYCKALKTLHRNTRYTVFDQSYSQELTTDGIYYVGGDIGSIPISGGTINKLACHHAFEHFQSNKDVSFIKEISRLLCKDGVACIIPLFICDIYIELWNIEKEGTFDSNAELLIDTSSTLPGAKQDGNFARIYDKISLQKRIIDIAKRFGLDTTIIECRLDGDTIPLTNENIGSKLNSPLRALILSKK